MVSNLKLNTPWTLKLAGSTGTVTCVCLFCSTCYEAVCLLLQYLIQSCAVREGEGDSDTGWRPVFPGSSRLGIEPKTPGWRVCVCVFIAAGPSTKLFAWGGGDIGGHVLRETTSRGLCGLVCPSRTRVAGANPTTSPSGDLNKCSYYCGIIIAWTLCVFITAGP